MSTKLYLENFGVSMELARDFIMRNTKQPHVILDAAIRHHLTAQMLADIVGNGYASYSASQVNSWFEANGLDPYQIQPLRTSSASLFTAIGSNRKILTDGYGEIGLDSVGGYYRTLFELAAASYYHTEGMKYLSAMEKEMPEDDPATILKKTSLLNLLKFIDFGISAQELGLESGRIYNEKSSFNAGSYAIDYKDGYYVGYNNNNIDTSSVALVGRSANSLFIGFRGSDVAGDFLEDAGTMAVGMEQHYKRYEPLFAGIENYLKLHPEIDTVYVSGHSLGGQMVSMFMQEHKDTSKVKYNSVTFEAANKELGVALYDNRNVGFEMDGDIVPDLGYFTNDTWVSDDSGLTKGHPNYGKSVYLNYERDYINYDGEMPTNLIEPHFMANINHQIDRVFFGLSAPQNLYENQRVYVDEKDNVKGFVVADDSFWSDYYNSDLLTKLQILAFPGSAAVIGASSGGVPGVLTATISGTVLAAAAAGSTIGGIALTLGTIASAITAPVLEHLIMEIKREDDAEYAQSILGPVSGVSDYQIRWADSGPHTLVIRPLENQPNQTYALPAYGVNNVIVANDIITLSEKYNLMGTQSKSSLLLMGNDASNLILGSDNDDVIIGNGEVDTIFGGSGNDTIFGGSHSDHPELANSKLNAAHREAAKPWIGTEFRDARSYLFGGPGDDIIYCSGNSDYVFVKHGLGIDYVKYFDPDSITPDYLIFSIEDLGISGSLTDIATKDFTLFDTDFWKLNAFNFQVGDKYWLDPNANEDTFFVLSNSLYFDQGGEGGNLPVKLLTLENTDGGIEDIDGANILLYSNRETHIDFNTSSVSIIGVSNVSGSPGSSFSGPGGSLIPPPNVSSWELSSLVE